MLSRLASSLIFLGTASAEIITNRGDLQTDCAYLSSTTDDTAFFCMIQNTCTIPVSGFEKQQAYMVADFAEDMVPMLTSGNLEEPFVYAFKNKIAGKKLEDADAPRIQKKLTEMADACSIESISAYLSCISLYSGLADEGYKVIYTLYQGSVTQVAFGGGLSYNFLITLGQVRTAGSPLDVTVQASFIYDMKETVPDLAYKQVYCFQNEENETRATVNFGLAFPDRLIFARRLSLPDGVTVKNDFMQHFYFTKGPDRIIYVGEKSIRYSRDFEILQLHPNDPATKLPDLQTVYSALENQFVICRPVVEPNEIQDCIFNELKKTYKEFSIVFWNDSEAAQIKAGNAVEGQQTFYNQAPGTVAIYEDKEYGYGRFVVVFTKLKENGSPVTFLQH